MESATVVLRLPACPESPGVARRGVVDGLALEGGLAARTALLVSEAVTNSVLHAGLAEGELVHVDARWDGADVRIEVCDEGGGLGSTSPAAPREGGFGLSIIESLSERWGVHTDGMTRVWFVLAG